MAIRHNLSDAFEPRSVALVGATDRPGSVGRVLLQHILESFDGPIGLVNAKQRRVAGRDTVSQPEELATAPDLAVIATPPAGLERAVEGLAVRGCKAAVVVTDTRRGPDGRTTLDAARLRAAAGPMRVIGPGSLGAAAPWGKVYASLSSLRPDPGGVAFISVSATPAGALVDWAKAHGVGFSHILALGDMVDVDYADALDLVAQSSRAEAAVLVMRDEAINARRFLSAGRALARVKPVIVMRSATPNDPPQRDQAYDAAFARAGMLRVSRLEEILAAVEAVSTRSPADARVTQLGPRLAVIANGESLAAFAVARVAAIGASLARVSDETRARLSGCARPMADPQDAALDLSLEADAPAYRIALDALADDRGVDAILVINSPTGVVDGQVIAETLVETVNARRARPGCRRPWVFACWPGGGHAHNANAVFDAAQIPHFQTPSEALDAYGRLLAYRRLQDTLMQTPGSRPEAFSLDRDGVAKTLAQARADGRSTLSPEEAHVALSAYNIACRLSDDDGPAAADHVAVRVHVAVDAIFGPVLTLGLADRVGRVLDAGVAALPPLTLALAEQMIAGSPVAAVLEGQPEAQAAIALLLVQTAQLTTDHGEVASVALDPVCVSAGVARVEHAVIAVQDAPCPDPADRLAIRPYPIELERTVTDRAGDRYLLRPIRPEDEPALVDLIGRLDPEHLRLRFFQPIRHVSHEFAARLTQIDYDRDMALVLVDEGGRPGACTIRGVARLARNGDREMGEYAVTVESSLQGRGLGRVLMEAIITEGRRAGMTAIFGVVLPENRSMLVLAEALGFVRGPDPEDPHLARVTLQLQKERETTT